MHVLLVTKKPQFDERGHIVPGQCEAHTEGWELRLFMGASEEVLLRGSYREMCRLQAEWGKKPPEAIRECARASSGGRGPGREAPAPPREGAASGAGAAAKKRGEKAREKEKKGARAKA